MGSCGDHILSTKHSLVVIEWHVEFKFHWITMMACVKSDGLLSTAGGHWWHRPAEKKWQWLSGQPAVEVLPHCFGGIFSHIKSGNKFWPETGFSSVQFYQWQKG